MKAQNKWQLLSTPFNKELKNALQQQHLAAQFIALTGRYIIPQKPDFSNINMQYHSAKEMLLGNQLPGDFYIGLHLQSLKVQILNSKMEVVKELSLIGKSFDEVFQEFKALLGNLKIDISGLKTEQPFELTTDSLKEGKYFFDAQKANQENIFYRHNAEVIISEMAARFKDAIPVRIWPHHFDTGTFAPIATNKKGDTSKTIGIGWAIPDSMVDEPYFYLSFWSESPVSEINDLLAPGSGKWMMPEWNGAVLKLSDILEKTTPESQYNFVKSFFGTGIDMLLEKMK